MDVRKKFKEICRSCMKKEKAMKTIFNSEINSIPISQMLSFATLINVRPDDGLPSSICYICLNRLIGAYKFQQMCVDSDILMRAQLKDYYKKIKTKLTITQNILDELRSNVIDGLPSDSFDEDDDNKDIYEITSVSSSLISTADNHNNDDNNDNDNINNHLNNDHELFNNKNGLITTTKKETLKNSSRKMLIDEKSTTNIQQQSEDNDIVIKIEPDIDIDENLEQLQNDDNHKNNTTLDFMKQQQEENLNENNNKIKQEYDDKDEEVLFTVMTKGDGTEDITTTLNQEQQQQQQQQKSINLIRKSLPKSSSSSSFLSSNISNSSSIITNNNCTSIPKISNAISLAPQSLAQQQQQQQQNCISLPSSSKSQQQQQPQHCLSLPSSSSSSSSKTLQQQQNRQSLPSSSSTLQQQQNRQSLPSSSSKSTTIIDNLSTISSIYKRSSNPNPYNSSNVGISISSKSIPITAKTKAYLKNSTTSTITKTKQITSNIKSTTVINCNNEIDKDDNEVKMKIVAYVCNVCKKVFTDKNCFVTHKRTECPRLQNSISMDKEESNNVSKNSDDLNFRIIHKCILCKTMYKQKCDLEVHIYLKHKSKAYQIINRETQKIPEYRVIISYIPVKRFNEQNSSRNQIYKIENFGHDIIYIDDDDNRTSVISKTAIKTTTTASSSSSSSKSNPLIKNFIHQCNICKKLFSNLSILNKHIINEHQIITPSKSNQLHDCNLCNKTFETLNDLKSHINEHQIKVSYGTDSKSANPSLNVSVDVHTNNNSYTCQYCEGEFNSTSEIHEHLSQQKCKNFRTSIKSISSQIMTVNDNDDDDNDIQYQRQQQQKPSTSKSQNRNTTTSVTDDIIDYIDLENLDNEFTDSIEINDDDNDDDDDSDDEDEIPQIVITKKTKPGESILKRRRLENTEIPHSRSYLNNSQHNNDDDNIYIENENDLLSENVARCSKNSKTKTFAENYQIFVENDKTNSSYMCHICRKICYSFNALKEHNQYHQSRKNKNFSFIHTKKQQSPTEVTPFSLPESEIRPNKCEENYDGEFVAIDDENDNFKIEKEKIEPVEEILMEEDPINIEEDPIDISQEEITIPNLHYTSDNNDNSNNSSTMDQSNKKQKHQCDVCGLFLATYQGVLRHQKRWHGDKQPFYAFMCIQCGKGFRNNEAYNRHTEAHHTIKKEILTPEVIKNEDIKFNNPNLDETKTTFEKPNLNETKTKFENEVADINIKCKYCDRIVNNRSNLRQHIRRYHNENYEKYIMEQIQKQEKLIKKENVINLNCCVCGKQFESKELLSRHVEIHRQFIKEKRHVTYLNRKKRRNKGFRFVKKKKYSTPRNNDMSLLVPLKNQDKTDNSKINDRNSRMSIPSTSSSSSSLSSFSLKNIKCPICCKICTSIDMLKRHMRSVHIINGHIRKENFIMDNIETQGIQFECHICSSRFNSYANFVKHKKAYHCGKQNYVEEAWYQCETCKKRFIVKSNYEAHRKIHETNAINNLLTRFASITSTSTPAATNNDKKINDIKESNEKKESTTPTNQGNENNEKDYPEFNEPHRCVVCRKICSNRQSLSRHMRKMHLKDIREKVPKGSKIHQCHICTRIVTTPYKLKCHLRSHTPDEEELRNFEQSKQLENEKTPSTTPIPKIQKQTKKSKIVENTKTDKDKKYSSGRRKILTFPSYCKICKHPYSSSYNTRRHIIMEHQIKPNEVIQFIGTRSIPIKVNTSQRMRCKICCKFFHNIKAYKNHISSCKPYRPPIQSDVITTDKLIHSDTDNVCKICGNKFLKPADLKRHLNMKHRKIIEEAKENENQEINSTVDTDSVADTADEEENNACEICGNKFLKPADLKRHINMKHRKIIQESKRKINSTVDTVDTADEEELEEGTTSTAQPQNKRPRLTLNESVTVPVFICKICGRKFNKKFHLSSHQEYHDKGYIRKTKVGLICCKICNKYIKEKVTIYHFKFYHAFKDEIIQNGEFKKYLEIKKNMITAAEKRGTEQQGKQLNQNNDNDNDNGVINENSSTNTIDLNVEQLLSIPLVPKRTRITRHSIFLEVKDEKIDYDQQIEIINKKQNQQEDEQLDSNDEYNDDDEDDEDEENMAEEQEKTLEKNNEKDEMNDEQNLNEIEQQSNNVIDESSSKNVPKIEKTIEQDLETNIETEQNEKFEHKIEEEKQTVNEIENKSPEIVSNLKPAYDDKKIKIKDLDLLYNNCGGNETKTIENRKTPIVFVEKLKTPIKKKLNKNNEKEDYLKQKSVENENDKNFEQISLEKTITKNDDDDDDRNDVKQNDKKEQIFVKKITKNDDNDEQEKLNDKNEKNSNCDEKDKKLKLIEENDSLEIKNNTKSDNDDDDEQLKTNEIITAKQELKNTNEVINENKMNGKAIIDDSKITKNENDGNLMTEKEEARTDN